MTEHNSPEGHLVLDLFEDSLYEQAEASAYRYRSHRTHY